MGKIPEQIVVLLPLPECHVDPGDVPCQVVQAEPAGLPPDAGVCLEQLGDPVGVPGAAVVGQLLLEGVRLVAILKEGFIVQSVNGEWIGQSSGTTYLWGQHHVERRVDVVDRECSGFLVNFGEQVKLSNAEYGDSLVDRTRVEKASFVPFRCLFND